MDEANFKSNFTGRVIAFAVVERRRRSRASRETRRVLVLDHIRDDSGTVFGGKIQVFLSRKLRDLAPDVGEELHFRGNLTRSALLQLNGLYDFRRVSA